MSALNPPPDNTFAVQDFIGMAAWATLDAELDKRALPELATLAGAALGAAAWQYGLKQRAAAYYAKNAVSGAEIGADIAEALSGKGLAAFGNIEGSVEDDIALSVFGRPGAYLLALTAVGLLTGKRLPLPDYLTIAAAGAGTGSLWRAVTPSASS